jgi:hypothetical protein
MVSWSGFYQNWKVCGIVVVLIDNPLRKVCGALKRSVCSGRWCSAACAGRMAVGYGVLAKVAAAELVVWSWSLVAGRCLVAERGHWSCSSCPVCWTWPPENRGSCPWRSEEPMTPKTDRSGLNVVADWLMWSLMNVGLELCLLYQAWWVELRLAVAAASADWPAHVRSSNGLDIERCINTRVNSKCCINMLTGMCSSVLLT